MGLLASAIFSVHHRDAEAGKPPRLLDAQVGNALANGVADLRLGQEIHQELFHAAHQPRSLEDRHVQFAGDGVAPSMVLADSFGEPGVAVVGRYVGPGERSHVVGGCGRCERACKAGISPRVVVDALQKGGAAR